MVLSVRVRRGSGQESDLELPCMILTQPGGYILYIAYAGGSPSLLICLTKGP